MTTINKENKTINYDYHVKDTLNGDVDNIP